MADDRPDGLDGAHVDLDAHHRVVASMSAEREETIEELLARLRAAQLKRAYVTLLQAGVLR